MNFLMYCLATALSMIFLLMLVMAAVCWLVERIWPDDKWPF